MHRFNQESHCQTNCTTVWQYTGIYTAHSATEHPRTWGDRLLPPIVIILFEKTKQHTPTSTSKHDYQAGNHPINMYNSFILLSRAGIIHQQWLMVDHEINLWCCADSAWTQSGWVVDRLMERRELSRNLEWAADWPTTKRKPATPPTSQQSKDGI